MKYLSLIAASLVIVGCQSTGHKGTSNTMSDTYNPAVSSGINGVYSGGNGYRPSGSSNYDEASNGDYYANPSYGQSVQGGPRAPAKDRVIYFSYDSATVDARAQEIIRKHAAYLSSRPSVSITLEGHTDSRGSREYNIALGERRAQSVKELFARLNVSPQQVRIVSYGEENPAVRAYNEQAYQRNRRAVIQY